MRIDDLEEECICDIENNLDKWASEFSMGEMEEITKNKEEIKKKIDELAMLRNRKKESIDIEISVEVSLNLYSTSVSLIVIIVTSGIWLKKTPIL